LILIKLLLSGKQILIVISLSLFIYIGYNVLTAEASEKEDKQVCEDYNGKWKETIRVDVDGNEKGSGEKQCQFDNDKDLKLYSIRPGHSLDGTGSDAEYGREDLGLSDDEAANIEDEICDNEDAKTTKIDICKSPKNVEDGYKGKRYVNPDGGAPLYEDELTEEEKDEYTEYKPEKEKVEDWKNKVEPIRDDKIPSDIAIPVEEADSQETNEPEEDIADYNEAEESNDEEEEQDEDESEDDEQEEDEPEEDNSDSES
jgi:hypothetical protein